MKEEAPRFVHGPEAHSGVNCTARHALATPVLAGLLLLFSTAAGAATVQLPAGEDAALWEGPLAVAGLEAGPTANQSEWVALVPSGSS